MIVEIKGVQFVNKGAHLMLLAVRERLLREFPDVEIALAIQPNSPKAARAEVAQWGKRSLRWRGVDANEWAYRLPDSWVYFMRRYGFVTEWDVDAVLDASGFAYGAAWGDWALKMTAGELERAARHDKPYVFLPQAFGPFAPGHATRLFGASIGTASLIYPRDEESRRHLLALDHTLEARLQVQPDFTIGMPGDRLAASRHGVGGRTVLVIPNSQMLGNRNPDRGAREGYLPLLRRCAAAAQDAGFEVRWLNHEGSDDAALCSRLAGEGSSASAVIEEADPLAVKGLIGAAAAVVSSRYHGCVSALSQGVPCIGTTWSHKYAELFADFGVTECLLQNAAAEPEPLLRRLLDDRQAHGAALRERATALATKVERMWGQVFEVLRAMPRETQR